MENVVCVDTDIIIDHLRGKGDGVYIYKQIVISKIPYITTINKFELLCGARNKKEIAIVN